MFWNKKERSDKVDSQHAVDLNELMTLRGQTKTQQHTINELRATVSSYESNMEDTKKLKAQVRKQSEADLLVNALKSVGIIPDKREGFDHFAEDSRLRQMAGARGGGNPYNMGISTGSLVCEKLLGGLL